MKKTGRRITVVALRSGAAAAMAMAALAAGCCTCAEKCGAAALAKPAQNTLIAHRGESEEAPENTLPAYKLAVANGFGFECDVYLSTDGEVFTFHDRNLKRTAGVDKKCEEASWKELVSKVDVGGWKGEKWKGTRPALLSEVLELARDGRYIYVEIKSGPNIVPYVKNVFAKQSRATPANVLFICFDAEVCAELKRQMPEYKVYWLTGPKDVPNDTDRIIATLKRINADGVDIHFVPSLVTKDYVDRVRAAGYEFHVWTIDRADWTLQAFSVGAQTVTTNRPKKLLAECQR